MKEQDINIILLIGMPGAGKTTLGNQLVKNYPEKEVLFVDDISKVTNSAREFLLGLNDGLKTIIISDVFFCNDKILNGAVKLINEVYPNCKIEKLYFENDKEKCLKNVETRKKSGDDRKVERLIEALSEKYVVSDNVKKITIKCD